MRITDSRTILYLINPHVCEPAQQEALAALLLDGIDNIYSREPGFIAAGIHASADGRRVTNLAQYRDEASVMGAWKNPKVKGFAEQVGKLATGYDPKLYRLRIFQGLGAGEEVTASTSADVFIGVHDTDPKDQVTLIERLEKLIQSAPVSSGAARPIAAAVFASEDGTRVAEYTRWAATDQARALAPDLIAGAGHNEPHTGDGHVFRVAGVREARASGGGT